MSILRVVENDVEFFTIIATGECKMSESGVARLCSVTQQSMYELVERTITGKSVPETLKEFAGRDLRSQATLMVDGVPRSVNLLPSDYCAATIEYFAFESRHKTQTALYSYRKFAKMGIESWIQNITGWTALPPKPELTMEAAEEMLKTRIPAGATAAFIQTNTVIEMLRENEFSADGLRLYFYLEMISLQNKTPDVATICQDLNIARSTFNKWLPKVHENTNCANWIEPARRKGPEYIIQLRLHEELGGKMEAYTPIGPMVYDRP
jgi:hypothetical protein